MKELVPVRYGILGGRFTLSFGFNIRSVDEEPVWDMTHDGDLCISPFTGLEVFLPFIQLRFGYVTTMETDDD